MASISSGSIVGRFGAAVEKWEEKTVETQTAIIHEALRLLDVEIRTPVQAGGRMPVEEGNLRNSATVSSLGRAPIDFKVKRFRDPQESILAGIAGIKIGDTAYYSFRAPYAYKAEVDYAFVRLAAQRWSSIVDQAAANVRGST